MNFKIMTGSAALAGIILVESGLQHDLQAVLIEQPHLEISIEEPLVLDVSSRAASGTATIGIIKTPSDSFKWTDSAHPNVR